MALSSNNYITDTVSVGKLFSFTLTEPICRNCDWHLSIPTGVILADRKHETGSDTVTSTTWAFTINRPGTYIIDFTYQKRCCGKPILKQKTYKITAH